MPQKNIVANLSDIYGMDLAGYQIKSGYYLELEHGLMGSFPALLVSTRRPVICLSIQELEKVRACLPPRASIISEIPILLVDKEKEIGFALSVRATKECTVLDVLSGTKLENLCEDPGVFEWAPGLL